ncbi:MAG: M15 family metallopeptidase [Anaerolineae bacterium]
MPAEYARRIRRKSSKHQEADDSTSTAPPDKLNQQQAAVLELQRMVGNRAAQALIGQNAAPQAQQLQRQEAATAPDDIVGAIDPEVQAARNEWNAHRRIHHYFHNGFESYMQLRPRYQDIGIANPAEYLALNIVSVTFFGHRTPAHRDMIAPLQAAETALRQQGVDPTIDSFWAFNPRLTSRGRLSNHAMGRAVDINPRDNPHVMNADQIRVIEAVTGVNLGTREDAETMSDASADFQDLFNEAWVQEQRQRLTELEQADRRSPQARRQKQLVRAIERQRATLNTYAARGFLNLDLELIEALQDAGFNWGGNWRSEKDFMHFELP